MVDWNELRETLQHRFVLDLDEEDELAFTVSATEGGAVREQRVMMRRLTAWDREIVEIRSAFGEAPDHDPVELLRAALTLPIGGIALHGRYLVVLHRSLLADLSVDGALFLAQQIGALADELEAKAGGDRF